MFKEFIKWICINIKSIVFQNRKNIVRLIISSLSILIILVMGSNEIKNVNISYTVHLLYEISKYKIFLFIIGGLIAVFGMVLYDYCTSKYFNLYLPVLKIIKISWIANTFNNLWGIVALTGATLRTILYKKQNVSIRKFIYANSILIPSTITGLSFLAIIEIFNFFGLKSVLLEHKFILISLMIFGLYLPFYFLLYRINWLKEKLIPKGLKQIEPKLLRVILVFVSIFEWTLAGGLLWFICRSITIQITFGKALFVIAASSAVGIISLIPGGIGAFDLVFYWVLQLNGVVSYRALAILIIYRAVYYVIPWIIGVALSIWEVRDTISKNIPKAIVPITYVQKSLSGWQRIWISNYEHIVDFGVWALSILVFICGIILLVSAAIPGIASRIDIIADLTSFAFMRFSYRISIVIGLLLLVISRGIKERVKMAYYFTVVLLLTGALFTFFKGLNYEEALFLLFVAFLLWFTRKGYYRESAPVRIITIIRFIIITILALGLYVVVARKVNIDFIRIYKEPGIISKIFTGKRVIIDNAIYAFGLTWFLIGVGTLIRPKRPFRATCSEKDLEKLKEFLTKYGGSYRTHLLFMRDKNFYWAQEDKVLIAYSNIRDKLVVLGDPIGDEAYFEKAIQEFQAFADRYGMNPAFYQVSEKYLSMYHENGYYFFKLGEEAIVDLTSFNLEGKKKKDMRLVKNRFEKDNLRFEVIHPPFSKSLMLELEKISNDWLKGRKEKGFSLGYFQEEYVNRSPVAVIKNNENQIIAFATLMPKYDNNKSMAVDLMRFREDAPNGTMDTLFLQLILWCQTQGYENFNVGMAPLSKVGVAPYAHRQEKLAKIVYNLGNHWYSFSGLRKYKEKFDPNWESKYLAYPQFISLPTLILDIALLVSKHGENKFKK
ncbi:phosphatidylglycerol lysyltransferase [Clostridium homopropionicum DSM 5847]|uniref:Phosphatidylglycerol lysyltransferase n=1 Tax=Clostridium homopropionicum DSM 5847 TaxID=1121318 RepID=A0A0L6ZCC4_9CLOT|nr:bifunctional lysylphosphatidylglycerol flippase/synthetase MprF [Clostridium homopropionicum]KOA20634.1 phosphatidylglycerol lysyltransferase [Clostridium homopropionicum DSM 5847]SFF92678.1 phosphatidylglycerol lysyltransferase [Clostridium homopropionicum]